MNRNLVLFFLLLLWIISIPALGLTDAGNAYASDRTTVPTPYIQNFNGTFPPSGWENPPTSVSYPEGGGTFSTYFYQRFSQAYAPMSSSIAGAIIHLISPEIHLPNNETCRLSFKWSHGQLSGTNPNLDFGRVLVEASGFGDTVVWQRFGTDFNSNDGYSNSDGGIPGSGVLESIDLGAWAGHDIQIIFEAVSSFGPYWYIDDFAVQHIDSTINSFPYTQDFASTTFPPTYWSVPQSWEAPDYVPAWRRDNNAYDAPGTGSALFSFANQQTGTQIMLTTQYIDLGAYGGTLGFDYAYSPYLAGNPAEELDIEYSNTLGNSFYPLASYNAGSGGGLVTATPYSSGSWTPAASDWVHSQTITLPPGTKRIRFRGTSAHNGRLFIDNIRLERQQFASGTGTQADPFTVSSAEDLNRIRNYLGSASSRTYFKLIADIDMDTFLSPGGEGYAMWGTQGWNPIGNSTSTMFYGGLDGDGHTISNLRTSFYETYHGLFGMTAAGSMIKNLHLSSSCSILGNGDTGSIVGHNKGTIENCSSAATVNIGNATIGGGICGNHNAGSIINCSFSGTVSRSAAGVNANSLGGIAGRNETSAVITNCSSSGTITGSTWNGGLVGWNNGTINLSYSTGIVSCNNNTIGGLVGQNQGSINNSYSRVNVTGAHYIGGLVGYHGSGSILNCYSTGTVSGGQKGGLIGASGGTVTSSYWDTQTSGIATSFGGTGKTTAQMQTQSTYTGWDFGVETENGTNDYWFMTTEDNGTYPFLIWEKAGELRAPILLSPADQATAMPVGGFNLSWSPNPIGLVPNWYNVYLRRYNALGVMEERLVTGLMNTTSFNPCNLPGFAPAYEATWYWTVEAVRQGTVVRRLPLCSFQFEQDPVIDTFPSSEDFANPAFPPYSWSNTGWERHSVNAFGAAGDGSARAYFYLLDIGVTVDLITKRIDNHGLGGNLSFDFAYTPDGTRIDLLEILASTDDGASYSSLATYTGGVDGSLNTTPGQTIETDFVPSASQWATRSLAFPAGTDYIKFRGTSAHGNNLFIDNITFDSLPLLSPSNVQISADFWGQGTITWEAVPGATWYGFYMGTDPNNLSYIGYTTRLIMLGDFFNYDKLFFRISAGNGSPVGNDLTWWGF